MADGAVKVFAAFVIAAVLIFSGWKIRGWRDDARTLDASNSAREELKKTVLDWATVLQSVTAERERDRQKSAADRREWQGRLQDANNNPGLRPRSAGYVDVELWNSALAIGRPAALGAWPPDGHAAAADSVARRSAEAGR